MKKHRILKSIVCFLLIVCCFMPSIYAASPQLVVETIKTSDDDDKALVEKKGALIFGKNDDLGGFKFSTDEDGNISFSNETNEASGGTIIFIDANDSSKKYVFNVSGNIIPNGDGYILNLGEKFNNIAAGKEFIVQVKDNSGRVTSVGNLSLETKTAAKKEDGLLKNLWKWLTDAASQVATLVEEILVELLLPLGDGILYMISRSVGEVVTTSKLVYNQVNKVSVDYWNRSLGATSVAGMMSKVVVPWYSFFKKIAVIVFMMCLIIVGIKIIFGSTGEQQAKFKEGLVSWVAGVAILMFFPYVMKYVVVLNNTMIQSIADFAQNSEGEAIVSNPGILNLDFGEAVETFGTSAFVELMTKKDTSAGSTIDAGTIRDSMMRLRLYAQYKKKVILVAVYFIMIGQLIVILFMYYKRAFMVAFLITIFPLVAMTYVLDKMGDKKAQSFEIWFKEYLVNVIVQLFHAVVFAVIVSMGVERYLNNDSQWLFMIISVLFLFEGEKILRNIFGIKSSANTIGDMAATGAAVWAVAKGAKGVLGGGGDKTSAQDAKDAKGIQDRMAQRANMSSHGGANAAKPAAADPTNPVGGGNTAGTGSFEGNDPAGVGPAVQGDTSAARDTVLQKAMSSRLKRGFASKAISKTAKLAGAGIAATYGMSKGDTGSGVIANTLASAAVGKAVGETLAEPVAAITNKVEQKVTGNKVAKQVSTGELDEALGLKDGTGIPPNLNPNDIIGKQGETVQEIYRQALIEMARVGATKGKAKAEQAYWNYIDDHTVSKS